MLKKNMEFSIENKHFFYVFIIFIINKFGENFEENLYLLLLKFNPKSRKICPYILKSNILDYGIILTMDTCGIRHLFKSSSEKHPNYEAKFTQSHRKSHLKIHALLSRSTGSRKKNDALTMHSIDCNSTEPITVKYKPKRLPPPPLNLNL